MPLNPMTPDLVQALMAVVPPEVVSTPGPSHLSEPRGRWNGTSLALARPRDVAETSQIIRFAAEHKIGIIPYAGGTGLVGGQVAEGVPTLLLSVERMDKVRDVQPQDNVMVVEAGVVLADAQVAAQAADRLFPLSLASEGSARIGGLLGTNAGGVQVLRYGNMRDLCLGVEAVLPDGSVVHGLRRLRKDNTGYDLRNLLIGSEGTLGVITAACLRLFPRPVQTGTAMVAVASPDAALALLDAMRDRLGETLSAFELIHGQGLAFLDETLPDVAQPFTSRPQWSVLIEATGGAGAQLSERLEAGLGAAMEHGLVQDALIAQNSQQAAAFWTVRESIPAANRRVGAIASHDISVPVSAIPAFIERAQSLLLAHTPDLRINSFGHLGDGNLHYNLFPPRGKDRAVYADRRAEFTTLVHDLVDEMGGSVSAEHGVGRLKAGDLKHYGDPAKLAAMRSIKTALDPFGIMNPGAILIESTGVP
ncbi:MAG: FAD-binding oxidoreductase [Pseudomonadota bacterium]